MKFKAPPNVIVFRTADLDRPSSPTTLNSSRSLVRNSSVSWLAERKAALTVAARAKWILLRLLGGHRPELGEVAKDLGMSIRILQRGLRMKAPVSVGWLAMLVANLAKHYLLDPSLELAEIACLLEYEDPNSFFRAFREWKGTTPGERRAAAAQSA